MNSSGLLYHEKQIASLCGVHCLNSLLQGPIFSAMDLADAARQLDQRERAIMSEGGETDELRKFIAEGSHNLAPDGNFSVQVLAEALAVYDLKVVRLNSSEDVNRNPLLEEAFICNLAEHWLTIRKVGGHWFNFNSIYPAPEPLSEFYLAAFLDSLQQEGYSIFIVRGFLPPPQPVDYSNDCWKRPEVRRGTAQGQMRVDPAADPELARVLAESLRSAGYTNEARQRDDDLEAAIRASLADSERQQQHQQQQQQQQQLQAQLQQQQDEEERRALAMSYELSLAPEPPAGEDAVTLALRFPSGERVQRRFGQQWPWQAVYDFIGSRGIDPNSHVLRSTQPRAVFMDKTAAIVTGGLGRSAALVVEPLVQ